MGHATSVRFTDVEQIDAYVPEVRRSWNKYPTVRARRLSQRGENMFCVVLCRHVMGAVAVVASMVFAC